MSNTESHTENRLDFYKNLAKHPCHGIRKVDIDAILSTRKELDIYYDDSHIAGLDIALTRGKTYHIHTVWACGDFAEFLFLDNNGYEMRLNSMFFDAVNANVQPANIRTITAIDNESQTPVTLTMQFEILQENPDFDLQDAIRLACKDYVKNTRSGWKTWTNNDEVFTWRDFWRNVPDNICESYGFRKLTSVKTEPNVSLQESLVHQSDLSLNNAQVTEIINALVKQDSLACIDFLTAWQQTREEIPYYNYPDMYWDALEKAIRPRTDDPELWAYYMEHIAHRKS